MSLCITFEGGLSFGAREGFDEGWIAGEGGAACVGGCLDVTGGEGGAGGPGEEAAAGRPGLARGGALERGAGARQVDVGGERGATEIEPGPGVVGIERRRGGEGLDGARGTAQTAKGHAAIVLGLGRAGVHFERALGLAQDDGGRDLLAVVVEHVGRELTIGTVQQALAGHGGIEPALEARAR